MPYVVPLPPTAKGEPRWGVRWIEGTGKNGKPKVRQESFKTKREAVIARSAKEVASVPKRKSLRPKWNEQPRFEAVAESFLDSLKFPEPGEDPKEPVTVRGYSSILHEHVFPCVGREFITSVESKHFTEIYRRCDQLGMSPRTRIEALRLTKAVLNFAQQKQLIDAVPPNPIKKRMTRKEEDAQRDADERKFFSQDEVFTILRAADSLAEDDNKQTRKSWARYRPMVYFLIYTGARVSEARAFRKQDYSPDERRIYIRQSAPEGQGSNLPKTSSSRRWVPLHPELEEPLDRWMPQVAGSLVFGTTTDKPISLPTLYPRLLEPLMDRADLLASGNEGRIVRVRRDRKFHAFRHHYASWLVKEGANLKQLQKYLGHKRASFTLDVYGHLFDDDGQDLMARMSLQR